jgi:hypothetical protein
VLLPDNISPARLTTQCIQYSTYTGGREKVLAAAAKEILGSIWILSGVNARTCNRRADRGRTWSDLLREQRGWYSQEKNYIQG